MKKRCFSYCMIAFLLAVMAVSCSKSPDYLGKYEAVEASFLNDDKEQAPTPEDCFPRDIELTEKAIITNAKDTTECRYEVVNDTLVHIFMKGEKEPINLITSAQPYLQKDFMALKLRKKASEK